MGTVYLATDPVLGRQVALKLLRSDFEPELQDRFRREARSAARLNHPNVVSIYDLDMFDGDLFIAMEYVEGPTLAQIIRTREPLPLARKLEIIRDTCLGLSYAHRSGVIHRDIKPGNVIVAEDGSAKILDFGIAHMSGEGRHTQVGAILGTPNYMAPEQVRGEPVTPQTDIYSAGVVFYELLALRQAFAADTVPAVLHKILHGEVEPLAAAVPGLDPRIVAIVQRAIARDPRSRYSDATEMARELDAMRGAVTADAVVMPADAPVVPPTPAEAALFDQTVVRPRPSAPAAAPADFAGQTVILPPPAAATLDAAMPAVQLVVVRSGDTRRRGRTVAMDGPRLTIGRSSSCDLVLDDPSLSHTQAVIEYGAHGFAIRDAGSRNGTYVNGRGVRSAATEPLFFGATIELGDTALTFALGTDVKLPDLTGTLVASRYELRRLIRDSAKGAVYVGADTRTHKEVAVKLMSPELMRLESYREQFEREAAVGAMLHHPHICQVLDRGEDDVHASDGSTLSLRFLCLELMGGGSLQHRLREGVIPLDDALGIVERVADALEYAHGHGVVHGDLKPGAIVFSVDGHVYLTDFAFAHRALHEADGPRLGAPAYVAPEVWDHRQLSPATDQFALAVVTYQMLTGSLPFAGQENPAVRRKNFLTGPVPAHQEAAAYREEPLPRALSDTLARALSADAERRFPSVAEYASAVLGAARGRRAGRGAPQVFFSYRRDGGSGWANYFAKELKDQGIATFLDVQRIDRAQQFPERLSRAIEDCDVFVCLLGESTLQSAWVLEEIRQAHRAGKPMIPIFQEGFDPAAAGSATERAVEALLTYEAVHLFDVRNVHVHHSASDLAALVKNTVARL